MRDIRGARWLAMSVIIAALLAFGATARADSYTYENHTLKYAAPPGFCLMDRAGVFGNAAFGAVEKIFGSKVDPVAVYLDCDEFTKFSATHNSPIFHVGLLAVPKTGDSILVVEGTRRDEIDRVAARFDTIDLPSVNDQLKQHGQEQGFIIPELKEIRLLARDDFAAYAVVMGAGEGDRPSKVTVVAISMTGQLPFMNIMIALAGDPNVISTLLARQQRYMASIIARNETDAVQREQAQSTAGVLKGVSTFAGEGSVVVGLLCFLGAVWLLLRLRRA